MKSKPTIAIVGGTGKMGQWFKHFFEEKGLNVLIAGRRSKNKPSEIAKKGDIVIVSVPIGQTQKVIQEIIPHVNNHALLTDLTSFKVMPLETMKSAGCGTLGMHPLFGPTATISQGLKIVFCKQKQNNHVIFLEKLFKDSGIEVIYMSAEEHDYQMAYIQAFTHAINLLYAKIIFEQKKVLESKLLTPIFRLQSLVMGRVMHQDMQLIKDIQFYNPYFPPVLEAMLEQGKKLLTIIQKENENGFDAMFKEEKALTRNFANFSTQQTNKILQQVNEIAVIMPTKIPVGKLPSGARIAYLGPYGTFSHQATEAVFEASTYKKIPCDTFFDLFRHVADGKADFAIVPAENSTEGTVLGTLDYLIEFSLFVVGSVSIPINHCLLSKEKTLTNIHAIVSHPQAIAQCKQWINKNVPNAKLQSATSTTSVLEHSQRKYGYIAPELAAKKNGLNILAKNIQDSPSNMTKFYVLAKRQTVVKG
ncbi:MAG: prephenate dehydrogenase/arogenate dehydrogenase family protein, partial [Candidatus Levybacteria bacterium]|nr:prephenate dehydrogenase/arogenate dehydrogenase family protein [Candidatus Levybacteria bacterium]